MRKRTRQRNKRARSPRPQSDPCDVSESPGSTRRRYAPRAEPDCTYHTDAPIGYGRDVLFSDENFRDPGGYTLGFPYNRAIFTDFDDLNFNPASLVDLDWKGKPPPTAYVFGRDPTDGA